MTILNATLTTDAAYICQDTAVFGERGRPVGETRKIAVYPIARMMLGFSGSVDFLRAVRHAVEGLPQNAGDILAALPGIARANAHRPAGGLSNAVVAVGMGPEGPCGIALDARDGFQTHRLVPGNGHVIMPAEIGAATAELAALSHRAAAGHDVAAFHRALAATQARTFPAAVGGTIELVEITRTGISVRRLGPVTTPAKNVGEIFRRWAPAA